MPKQFASTRRLISTHEPCVNFRLIWTIRQFLLSTLMANISDVLNSSQVKNEHLISPVLVAPNLSTSVQFRIASNSKFAVIVFAHLANTFSIASNALFRSCMRDISLRKGYNSFELRRQAFSSSSICQRSLLSILTGCCRYLSSRYCPTLSRLNFLRVMVPSF